MIVIIANLSEVSTKKIVFSLLCFFHQQLIEGKRNYNGNVFAQTLSCFAFSKSSFIVLLLSMWGLYWALLRLHCSIILDIV